MSTGMITVIGRRAGHDTRIDVPALRGGATAISVPCPAQAR
jgi:hypothetical protein